MRRRPALMQGRRPESASRFNHAVGKPVRSANLCNVRSCVSMRRASTRQIEKESAQDRALRFLTHPYAFFVSSGTSFGHHRRASETE